jgi:hypothetical protein
MGWSFLGSTCIRGPESSGGVTDVSVTILDLSEP